MLGEAHGGNAVDGHRQDGDEQMDTCDPVSEKRPWGGTGGQFGMLAHRICFISRRRTVDNRNQLTHR